jgi:glycosyltransferase involved in cell wall biosynthesis
MVYLAYFIFIFSVVQLIVALTNLLFIQKPKSRVCNFNDLVSILIPARNEEKNIANLLHDLQNQDYQNIEIIVFNDQSTDKTAQIVSEFSVSDKRITLISSTELPEGWLGKNYACHSLSKLAKGNYYMFIDADVRISKDIIINTISYSKKYKLGLLSIFPKQMMLSIGEWITVPNMNFILLSLLPLILVRKLKFTSLAAANGQFMLFGANTYNQILPHEKMKSNKVEDIEIAHYYKTKGIRIACLTGNDNIKCRMYNVFGDAVKGFSKNVVNFFGNSFLIAVLFWLITSFGFIFFLYDWKIFILYLTIIIITRILISIVSRQRVLVNLLLIIPQQLSLGMFIYKAFTNKLKNQYQWKGRNIS